MADSVAVLVGFAMNFRHAAPGVGFDAVRPCRQHVAME